MKINNLFFNTIILMFAILFSANSVMSKTLNFAVVSDVHYSAKDNNDAKKALNGFVSRMNEQNYDFIVFLGDNIEKSKNQNLQGFLNITKKIKTSYYFVLGNRDAHKISGIEKKDYLIQAAKANKNQPKDKSSYYFHPNMDTVVIVLDNVSSGLQSSHGVFTQKTLLWLDEVLIKNKNKKAIIFQHVPYVPPYEKETHNLLSPNDYRAVLTRHNNIIAIISGHYHEQYIINDSLNITHISVPALFKNPYSYMDIRVDYKKPLIGKPQNIEIKTMARPAI